MKSSSKLKLLLRSMDPDVISFPYLCFPWIHELKLTCNRSPERLIWYRKWFTTLMRRVHEANLVTTLHFTTDLKQLLNRDSGGHLISEILLEESLRASFSHGWQWNLIGNDNSDSYLVGAAAMFGAQVENSFTRFGNIAFGAIIKWGPITPLFLQSNFNESNGMWAL